MSKKKKATRPDPEVVYNSLVLTMEDGRPMSVVLNGQEIAGAIERGMRLDFVDHPQGVGGVEAKLTVTYPISLP